MKKQSKKISFGTKAETLERLRGKIKSAVVDELFIFTVGDWKEKKDKIISSIKSIFGDGPVIIRSSALTEDSLESSNAGRFKSESNVSTKPNLLIKSIERVIVSYEDSNKSNQVFIQAFISNVDMSGVIFTRDINTFSPYITINYDDTSGKTDTVTSGNGRNSKTQVIFRGKKIAFKDKKINQVFNAAMELEKFFGMDALDIEFLYKDGVAHILQVRPLTIKNKKIPETKKIADVLEKVFIRIKELSLPRSDLCGDGNLYGIMPDWNPAEMIGIKPRPLTLSLYKELITDNIWAYQRDNYGYKALRSFPLMVSLAGHPYIDVRVDFNSFIPKVLRNDLSEKLVNFYLNKLKSMPRSHDKVEFDIVYSCYTLDLPERIKELYKNGFSESEVDEIKSSLLSLTNNIIKEDGLYKADFKKVLILEERLNQLLSLDLISIDKIYWLIEDCKRYGTLPFAGIARAAFIAVQFLDSLVSLNIISSQEKNLFLNSLHTVVNQLSVDIGKLSRKEISIEEFLGKYGHLRPGTYDILSESYDENINKYFDLNSSVKSKKIKNISPYRFSDKQIKKINQLLREQNISINAEQFLVFIKEVIEGREYAKFIFTKSVSKILKIIKMYGDTLGFSTDDMSYVEITTLTKLYPTVILPDEREILSNEIARNKKIQELCKYIKLPYLICNPSDVFSFYLDEIEPNFITINQVIGEVSIINVFKNKQFDLKGKIAFIESADPGYDWIFSHGIKGLVTAYGGANSHMAIRSAELNIPAVIGCGHLMFDKWKNAKKLEIDCLNKKVHILF
ncbi:MAG: PEP-utilizing enzyme [Candidatus Pacebacteria bacterium]|nr:PEP-utilizing enzyme [Candidatus Paceibacterota bacterium]